MCWGGPWLWHSEVIFTSYQRVCKRIVVARRNKAMRLADEVNMCRSRPSFSFSNVVFHLHILQKRPLTDTFSFHSYYHSSSRTAFRGRGLIKFNKNNNVNTFGNGGNVNKNKMPHGHWPSDVMVSSGKVSLSSFHLPPSISHHSLSLLLLSASLTPPHRHFCVCLSPGIPIEDSLRTVAR